MTFKSEGYETEVTKVKKEAKRDIRLGRKKSWSPAYADLLRTRIKAARAIDVLNGAIEGNDITATQLGAIRLALGKVLPDLQAIAVKVEQTKVSSRADIEAMLIQAGIEPALAFDDQPVTTIEGEVSD